MRNETWGAVQKHFGYSDEELERFKSDPRNIEVILKAPEFKNTTIVAEVVQAHGCNSGHRVGDRFYLDGAGNLIAERCPAKMCIYAVSALQNAVFAMGELLLAGVAPNELRFNRTGCFDVGVQCGGWGRIVLEVRAERV